MNFKHESCGYDYVDDLKPPYASGCRTCALRAMASSPGYASSNRLGLLTPAYRKALEATFPGEDVRAVHAQVKTTSERASNGKVALL